MDIVTILERSTQAECREIGELFLSLADSPRGPGWEASMAVVRERFLSPANSDLMVAIRAGNDRVREEMDKLSAEGLDHKTLLDAELERRGLSRDEIGLPNRLA